jgi:hypothetical protein
MRIQARNDRAAGDNTYADVAGQVAGERHTALSASDVAEAS